jgi:transcriptional regulator with XRE-family HTH domain
VSAAAGTGAAVAAAFAPDALGLARRWRQMRKNALARQVGVTAAAVSQYELGQARPSPAVLARPLVYRGHELGIYRDHTYRRMALLAQWGYPEPGDLGPREQPTLLGQAVQLLQQRAAADSLATQSGLPQTLVHTVIHAATDTTPVLRVQP